MFEDRGSGFDRAYINNRAFDRDRDRDYKTIGIGSGSGLYKQNLIYIILCDHKD